MATVTRVHSDISFPDIDNYVLVFPKDQQSRPSSWKVRQRLFKKHSHRAGPKKKRGI